MHHKTTNTLIIYHTFIHTLLGLTELYWALTRAFAAKNEKKYNY